MILVYLSQYNMSPILLILLGTSADQMWIKQDVADMSVLDNSLCEWRSFRFTFDPVVLYHFLLVGPTVLHCRLDVLGLRGLAQWPYHSCHASSPRFERLHCPH